MKQEFVFSEGEREVLDQILDEQERTYIQHFVDNDRLLDAVMKVLLIPLHGYGALKKGVKPRTDVNWVWNYSGNKNEIMAEQVRATLDGMYQLERGFAFLKTLKKLENTENKVENENQAI